MTEAQGMVEPPQPQSGMKTNFSGRVRNTRLPISHSLMPVFEAVVNSIQSLADRPPGRAPGLITVKIVRENALSNQSTKRAIVSLEPITDIEIADNGNGFDYENFRSFETLDTDHKAKYGCRGVGRLLWLKAFERVEIDSVYLDEIGRSRRRTFTFSEALGGVGNETDMDASGLEVRTVVRLCSFKKPYQQNAYKRLSVIAEDLLEHCLFYFVRPTAPPHVVVRDDNETIDLMSMYDQYIESSTAQDQIEVKGQKFELSHIRMRSNPKNEHLISWCAANRVVFEDKLSGKIPGLHGRIDDKAGAFYYACYVTSPFLDEHVHAERTGFNILDASDGLFSEEPMWKDIRDAVIAAITNHLYPYLEVGRKAGEEALARYAAARPRYRSILKYLTSDEKAIDPNLDPKQIESLFHGHYYRLESEILDEGQTIMNFGKNETRAQYEARIENYLTKVTDVKQSDLANYVAHRRVVLDILDTALKRNPDGSYQREELIHEIIMPMRTTSDDLRFDEYNLWIVDERLAFHNYLASDKALNSVRILDSKSRKEPDIFSLDVLDRPILITDKKQFPMSAFTIVELKRPMRDDYDDRENPIAQVLGYLRLLRAGKATTSDGRPIPASSEAPGLCYIICDLTDKMRQFAEEASLSPAVGGMRYYGYNDPLRAYIEVISFDEVLRGARERNRAFFDKLGLPQYE